ncbi:MAG TPA: CehA/McbA family metallohydrolase [Actinopolymorphaceae bacterium]
MSSWFRGNTHAHTELCGHADSSPETVARWYLDHGYHFATLSEHNLFIDPADVRLPEDRREDFILVPGEELTSEQVHMTALNLEKALDHEALGAARKIIATWSRRLRDVGGVPIVNHPNWRWLVDVDDLRPQQQCRLFELYNGHPDTNDEGAPGKLSTEAMWDTLLTEGKVTYAVASDDAHNFATWGRQLSNPGRGWVMVRADELTSDAVTSAMDNGDFYASSGVFLDVTVEPDAYRLAVDLEATRDEVGLPETVGQPLADVYPEGLTVEFIGPSGKVLASDHRPDATFARSDEPYVRARITWVEPGGDGRTGYRAWTQPAFRGA